MGTHNTNCSNSDFTVVGSSMLQGKKRVNQRLACCAEGAAYLLVCNPQRKDVQFEIVFLIWGKLLFHTKYFFALCVSLFTGVMITTEVGMQTLD